MSTEHNAANTAHNCACGARFDNADDLAEHCETSVYNVPNLDELETAANTAEQAHAASYYAAQRTHDQFDAAALKANEAGEAWRLADLLYTAAQLAADVAHSEFVRATNAHTDNVNTLNRARLAVREFLEAARAERCRCCGFDQRATNRTMCETCLAVNCLPALYCLRTDAAAFGQGGGDVR